MTDIETVWIGEAWDSSGNRLARAVHVNEAHARHDINELADTESDTAYVTVTEERVHHASGVVPA